MKEKLFDTEGPLFGFLDKTGQMIVLSFLWLIGCIPIVTISTSNAALYYAAVKSIRRGQGSAIKEFFKSFRENLLAGVCLTVLIGIALAMLEGLSYVLTGSLFPTGGSLAGMILICFAMCYTGPVMSRFRIGLIRIIKLSFLMSLQYAHYTLLFLVGTGVLIFLQMFFLPMGMIFILPGFWSWLSSFMMEKVLRRYMPPKADDDNNWYYEN